jgi:hemerythrin-like domain-containing protein
MKKNIQKGEKMKPIGPLMKEHRLIEQMVQLLDRQLKLMNETNTADVAFLMIAVDFFRTYADRTHHGKEEDILFKKLSKKLLSAKDAQTMKELVEEHVWARKTVTRLAAAKEKYQQGGKDALGEIVTCVKELIDFYPTHILKEDKSFFYPSLEYFSKEEQDQMLQEFWEFDRKLIHEKYQKIVDDIKNSAN